MKDVIEYTLDENNYITGWRLHPEKKRPDLIGIAFPPPEMAPPFKDVHGNYKWKLIEGQPVEVLQTPSVAETAKKQFKDKSLEHLLKALIDGIESDKTDPNYIQLKEIIYRITE